VTARGLTYAVITPAWNEAANLERLAGCLEAQTARPDRWVIVDTGSSDGTRELAEALAERHSWVRVAEISRVERPQPGAPIVRAFHAGLDLLDSRSDVVVKLDADVSFEPDYFEQLLGAFAADPSLGIASGECWEQDAAGAWRATRVSRGHVRGAARAYRSSCLPQVLPLAESVGWDGIDELKANIRGWRTGIVEGLVFLHHRAVGARDGARPSRWKAQGQGAYYMGYRFSYLVLRSLHRARSDPAALWMIGGYLAAARRREPRYEDVEVREYLRGRQKLRRLPLSARDALRRPAR
jgi:biofilm PGA synthesis N-glycosyltransferase PgaC